MNASKVRNSEFRVLGKTRNGDPWGHGTKYGKYF